MTNDQAPITKQFAMTNDQWTINKFGEEVRDL